MIEVPKIVQTTDQLTAAIRFRIPKADIQKVMGPAIEELMAVTAAQGVGPAGAWFSHHFRFDPDEWDFEVAVPVLAPVTPSGRVQPGRMPAARVARTIYHGAYDGMGAAWGQLTKWIEEHGHVPGRDFWEVYRTGPESSLDPANWRTELNWTVAG